MKYSTEQCASVAKEERVQIEILHALGNITGRTSREIWQGGVETWLNFQSLSSSFGGVFLLNGRGLL